MISTGTQMKNNQSPRITIYDERVRQLLNSIDSTSISSSYTNMNQMTSLVNTLHPEQIYLDQQRIQRHSLTNDLTTPCDRLSSWNKNNLSSASVFCGEITNSSPTFTNRNQSALHSSMRNTQQSPLITRPHLTASSIRYSSAATTNASHTNNVNALRRLSSSPCTNIIRTNTNYYPYLASRLSTSGIPKTPPAGSHDLITNNRSSIALSSLPSTEHASTTNAQSQKFIIVAQATTATFCYVPASDSLAYNNSGDTGRDTAIFYP